MTIETAPVIMLRIGKEMMYTRDRINTALTILIVTEIDSAIISIFGNKEEIARLETKISGLEKRINQTESENIEQEQMEKWKGSQFGKKYYN